MAANTSDRAVIGFVKDYDERELREKVDYQVTDGGVKSHLSVGISYGDSTEYFFLETVDKLEDVRDATQGGWTPAKKIQRVEKVPQRRRTQKLQEAGSQQLPKSS